MYSLFRRIYLIFLNASEVNGIILIVTNCGETVSGDNTLLIDALVCFLFSLLPMCGRDPSFRWSFCIVAKIDTVVMWIKSPYRSR